MKKFFAILLCLSMLIFTIGCGSEAELPETESQPETEAPDTPVATQQVHSAYSSAEEILSLIWDAMPEDARFSCYGGNQNTEPMIDEPGAFDVSDTDILSFLLLVPEEIQSQVLDGADLIYLTNACQFTGAALKISGNVNDFAAAVENAVVTQPFVNFAPETITTIAVGNYLVYAFGATGHVQQFVDAALANVQDAVLIHTAAIPFGE